MVIVILGMHRSGTSVIANVVRILGVDMGKKFIKPDWANETGYWEDIDFVMQNKKILKDMGGNWGTIFSRKQMIKQKKNYGNKIYKLVSRKQRRKTHWGWKDPRTCFTIEHYHPYLKAPRYIVMKRKQEDVVASLTRKYGKNDKKWNKLYKLYISHIWSFSKTNGIKTLEIDYADLTSRKLAPGIIIMICEYCRLPKNPKTIKKALATIKYRDANGEFEE